MHRLGDHIHLEKGPKAGIEAVDTEVGVDLGALTGERGVRADGLGLRVGGAGHDREGDATRGEHEHARARDATRGGKGGHGAPPDGPGRRPEMHSGHSHPGAVTPGAAQVSQAVKPSLLAMRSAWSETLFSELTCEVLRSMSAA